ncbi:snRNA-activating protein complex subunit 3 isoform X1 [Vespa crabro]|uniref:snRNA-activating protein complex subunit 3 isoform X1 n=1 Tax=Vespa crabro TaxID=7445 RepID=UPI001F00C831|nr:snRNA-activating protein complex subunit 3 isoform X1 [Vespa crabro]
MDLVYGHYNQNASEKINIKEYFEKYSSIMKPFYLSCLATTKDQSILKIMKNDLGNEEMDLLSEYCSEENLTVPGEVPRMKENLPIKNKDLRKVSMITEDINLETIRQLKKRKESKDQYLFKFTSELFIKHGKINKHNENTIDLAVPYEDIFIDIRIYEPFMHSSNQMKSNYKKTKPTLKYVITILGKQTLAELRDKIKCLSDLTIPIETSDNPNQPFQPMAKDVYKSGFFYIEDTFYNDFRDPANIDYSKVIIEWAKAKQLGPFNTDSMEKVTIDSLSVRFGYPWVYQHQGFCEHLIIFSDARLVQPYDELHISAYPRIQRIRPQRANYCFMCGLLPVRWITTDHDRVPHNPCFFCESCFKSYNYIDGKKIGNFKAYRYPCDSNLMREEEEEEEEEENEKKDIT